MNVVELTDVTDGLSSDWKVDYYWCWFQMIPLRVVSLVLRVVDHGDLLD